MRQAKPGIPASSINSRNTTKRRYSHYDAHDVCLMIFFQVYRTAMRFVAKVTIWQSHHSVIKRYRKNGTIHRIITTALHCDVIVISSQTSE